MTARAMRRARWRARWVRPVLRHEINRGKGGALKTGFAWAMTNGFDGVITLDADGQHLATEIPKFVRERERSGADLIVGGRAHLFGEMLPRRRMANQFSGALHRPHFRREDHGLAERVPLLLGKSDPRSRAAHGRFRHGE